MGTRVRADVLRAGRCADAADRHLDGEQRTGVPAEAAVSADACGHDRADVEPRRIAFREVAAKDDADRLRALGHGSDSGSIPPIRTKLESTRGGAALRLRPAVDSLDRVDSI